MSLFKRLRGLTLSILSLVLLFTFSFSSYTTALGNSGSTESATSNASTTIKLLSSKTTGLSNSSIYYLDKHVYIFGNQLSAPNHQYLLTYDVSNPSGPILVGKPIDLGSNTLISTLAGNYIYAASGEINSKPKLVVYSVANGSLPTLVTQAPITSAASALTADSQGNIYVATNNGYIAHYNFSNNRLIFKEKIQSGVITRSNFSQNGGLNISGNYLIEYNVTNSSAPREWVRIFNKLSLRYIDRNYFPASINALFTSGSNIYISLTINKPVFAKYVLSATGKNLVETSPLVNLANTNNGGFVNSITAGSGVVIMGVYENNKALSEAIEVYSNTSYPTHLASAPFNGVVSLATDSTGHLYAVSGGGNGTDFNTYLIAK